MNRMPAVLRWPGRSIARRRLSPGRAASAVVTAALLGVTPAAAVETQWWIADSPQDYAKAESRGVVVGPDGTLTLGPRAVASPAESLDVIWAILPLPDGSVALAGERGRIDRWTEGGGVRAWVSLPVGQVLSLAADGAGLLAGTGPGGLVYRVGARGDTALFARTGERYVWGLVSAGGGTWYGATGNRGRLLRIEGGHARVVLDTDESNLVSLIPDGRGGVYAGGDSKGRVVHLTKDGVVRTVFDATEDEIRGLALGPDGALYAAALSASAVTEEDVGAEHPEPAKSAVSGARATLYRIVPDSSAVAWWTSPQPFLFALLGGPDGVVAAAGNRAALYQVKRPNGASLWLAAPEGQLTALATGPGGMLYVASSNPGGLWRVGPGRAERGELLSPALDARRFARFGRLRWRGEAGKGKVSFSARSGNTDPPDTTWSPWEEGRAEEDGMRTSAPPARYLQWKLTFAGGAPRVDAVEVAYREQNQPPRVEELNVASQGQGFREGELTPRSEPVTQTLPGGQRVEYSISASGPQALRLLPVWARGLRTVQWHGSDPNGDPLRYRVEVQAVGGGPWIEVGDDLEASSFTWDTGALPDGRYRLRVTASDARGNAIGEELTGETVSEPFGVDNTAPVIPRLEVSSRPGAVLLEGRAEDASSTVTRVEAALDNGDWRLVTPEGGLADERALSFRARLDAVAAGEHTVSVRAVDFAGNTATRAARVSVPPAR